MLINKTSVNRIKGSDVGILIQKFALSFVFFKTYSKIGKTAQIEREAQRPMYHIAHQIKCFKLYIISRLDTRHVPLCLI